LESEGLDRLADRLLGIRNDRIPALVLVLCCATFLVTCFAILGSGYAPTDDANRHIAKVVSGKSWDDILVLREGFIVDSHPGWHLLLGILHRFLGFGKEGLLVGSVALVFCLATMVPLFFHRRPEAWVLSSCLAAVSGLGYARFMLGRPFVFTVVNTVLLLLAHRHLGKAGKPRGWLVGLTLSTAVCTWFHATTWFLYVLPLFAYAAVGRWRAAVRLSLVVAVGVCAGLVATGRPVGLLVGMPVQVVASVQQGLLPGMRVTELQPMGFPVVHFLTAVLVVALLRAFQRDWWAAIRHPALALALLGMLLGQVSARFWSDWGMVAMLVWLAEQATVLLAPAIPRDSLGRVAATLVLCFALYVSVKHGHGEFWQRNFNLAYWELEDAPPGEREWFPESGGIIYSPAMATFYRTFYANPKAPWRYALGFEPSLMTADNFETYQRIVWNEGDTAAFRPWIEKMRPEDRFVVLQAGKPPLPELEWRLVERGVWVGRKPPPSPQP
jgi:hypothetical protein